MKSLIRLADTVFAKKRPVFGETRLFGPKIEMKDEKDRVLVKAHLPGLKEKELKVSLKKNFLTIEAEKKSRKEEKGKNYHYSENSETYFQRGFTLPGNLEAEQMKHKFENGNLEIVVAKKQGK